MEFPGKLTLLREFEKRDVAALLAIHSDPRFLRYYAPELGTPEHTQMLVERFIEWSVENPRRNFQLAIADRETKTLLGSCGVRTKDCPQGQAEFGIGIGADWWGKGIASEAARMILRFAFRKLHLKEIRGVTVSENEAARKFASQPGFSLGIPRRGEAWMLQKNWSALDVTLSRETWERLNSDEYE